MKFTIITTFFIILLGGCVVCIIGLLEQKSEIQKQINNMYQDTPTYYKQYIKHHKKMFK